MQTRAVVFVVFAGANTQAGRTADDVQVAAADPGALHRSSGLARMVDAALGGITGPIDTLVLVGGKGAAAMVAEDRREVTRFVAHARRVTSVCAGVTPARYVERARATQRTTCWRTPTTASKPSPSAPGSEPPRPGAGRSSG